MLFSEVDRLPIMAKSTAKRVGEVLRYSIDPTSGMIVAIHAVHLRLAQVASALHLPTATEKLPEQLVDWDKIVGFGKDAVVIASEDDLRAPQSEEEERLVHGDFDLEKKLALSEWGERLGVVRDIAFDPETGKVERIILDNDSSLPAKLLAISPYAVVVASPRKLTALVFRARDLIDRPVVTLDTASDVAEVKDVIIDTASNTLQGVTLKGRGFLSSPNKGLLPIANIAAVGNDAVMIASAAGIVTEDTRLAEILQRSDRVIGVRVLTEAGRLLGTVAAVLLRADDEQATIVGYEIRREDKSSVFMPTPRSYSTSDEAFIVPTAIEAYLTGDLAGFAAMAQRYRASDTHEETAQQSA